MCQDPHLYMTLATTDLRLFLRHKVHSLSSMPFSNNCVIYCLRPECRSVCANKLLPVRSIPHYSDALDHDSGWSAILLRMDYCAGELGSSCWRCNITANKATTHRKIMCLSTVTAKTTGVIPHEKQTSSVRLLVFQRRRKSGYHVAKFALAINWGEWLCHLGYKAKSCVFGARSGSPWIIELRIKAGVLLARVWINLPRWISTSDVESSSDFLSDHFTVILRHGYTIPKPHR